MSALCVAGTVLATSGQCQELASALLKNINAPTEMRMSACERPHAQDLGVHLVFGLTVASRLKRLQ